MSRPAFAFALLCSASLGGVGTTITQAAAISQTASIPLSSTDFGPPGSNLSGKDPLVLQKFDTKQGARVLDSVDLSFHGMIKSDFSMTFTTPATITDSIATGDPKNPGPSLVLYQPDGKTPILSVVAPNDPATLTRTKTYGSATGQTLPQQFGSNLAPTSPFYLPPATFEQSSSINLTAPSVLSQFTGSGTVDLPVAASAFSKFTTSSGNGGGGVSTAGTADVTATYHYHDVSPAPQTLPEPGSVAVWGLAGVAAVLFRIRARRTR